MNNNNRLQEIKEVLDTYQNFNEQKSIFSKNYADVQRQVSSFIKSVEESEANILKAKQVIIELEDEKKKKDLEEKLLILEERHKFLINSANILANKAQDYINGHEYLKNLGIIKSDIKGDVQFNNSTYIYNNKTNTLALKKLLKMQGDVDSFVKTALAFYSPNSINVHGSDSFKRKVADTIYNNNDWCRVKLESDVANIILNKAKYNDNVQQLYKAVVGKEMPSHITIQEAMEEMQIDMGNDNILTFLQKVVKDEEFFNDIMKKTGKKIDFSKIGDNIEQDDVMPYIPHKNMEEHENSMKLM